MMALKVIHCLLLASACLRAVAEENGLASGGVYYPEKSLGYALETNYTALTNSLAKNQGGYFIDNDQPWTGFIWGSTNISKWKWNPNSILYGKRGATAISAAQLGGTQARFCLLTRRHAVTAGHYGGITNGLMVWFLGTNNLVHGMVVSNTAVRYDGEDRAIVTFTRDVPDDVQPMRIAAPLTNGPTGDIYALVMKYFPPEAHNPFRPRAGFWVCQHGYCGRNTQKHPGGTIGFDGGDSGAPGFLILGDECVNIGGVSMNVPTTNMLRRMDALTRGLKLDPSRYQPSYVWLTNYPTWPY